MICPKSADVDVISNSDSDSIEVTMDAMLILREVASESSDLEAGGNGSEENDFEFDLSAEAPSGSAVFNANFTEMFPLLAATDEPYIDSMEELESIPKMVTRDDACEAMR